jgi:hypothetical protein
MDLAVARQMPFAAPFGQGPLPFDRVGIGGRNPLILQLLRPLACVIRPAEVSTTYWPASRSSALTQVPLTRPPLLSTKMSARAVPVSAANSDVASRMETVRMIGTTLRRKTPETFAPVAAMGRGVFLV